MDLKVHNLTGLATVWKHWESHGSPIGVSLETHGTTTNPWERHGNPMGQQCKSFEVVWKTRSNTVNPWNSHGSPMGYP